MSAVPGIRSSGRSDRPPGQRSRPRLASFLYRASLAFGLLTLVLTMWFIANPPPPMADASHLPARPLLAFQLAASTSDLDAVLGGPADPERSRRLKLYAKINTVDVRYYIAAYGAFFLLLFGGLLAEGSRWPLVAIVVVVAALVGDYMETFTQLKIAAAADASLLLDDLAWGAWTKFVALAGINGALAYAILSARAPWSFGRKLLSGAAAVLLALGAPIVALAYVNREFAGFMTLNVYFGWMVALIFVALRSLRGVAAERSH